MRHLFGCRKDGCTIGGKFIIYHVINIIDHITTDLIEEG